MQENEAKRTRLHVILFRVTAVMLCATLVSCHMVSGLWARYATHADLGDNARVAVFQVSTNRSDGETGDLTQHLTGSQADDVTTYHIVITNDSEVSVNCVVSIRFASPVAQHFDATLSYRDTSFGTPAVSHDNTTLTWRTETIAGGTVTYLLELKMKQSSANAVALDESQTYPFDTFVTFEQAD